jgi:hypothetical protein
MIAMEPLNILPGGYGKAPGQFNTLPSSRVGVKLCPIDESIAVIPGPAFIGHSSSGKVRPMDSSTVNFQFNHSSVQKCINEGLTGFQNARIGASVLYSTVHGFAMLNLEEMLPGSVYDNSSQRAVLFEIIGLHFQVDTRQFI